MSIKVVCGCGFCTLLPSEWEGKRVRCKCGRTFIVGSPEPLVHDAPTPLPPAPRQPAPRQPPSVPQPDSPASAEPPAAAPPPTAPEPAVAPEPAEELAEETPDTTDSQAADVEPAP